MSLTDTDTMNALNHRIVDNDVVAGRVDAIPCAPFDIDVTHHAADRLVRRHVDYEGDFEVCAEASK